MSPLIALILLGVVAVVGTVWFARVVAWSFSAARRRQLIAKADATTLARHRANRRTA